MDLASELATELINPDSGMSVVAAAFFTGLFGMLGVVLVAVIQQRGKTKEALDEAKKASSSAEKASQNTKNVSNGFATRMDRKLDLLATNQDRLEEMFTEHLSWHLNKDPQEERVTSNDREQEHPQRDRQQEHDEWDDPS